MPNTYTRDRPSPRYERLLRLYRQIHVEGESFRGLSPEHVFPGKSLPPQAPHIKRLIGATGARDLLDYGSGKGQQYRYWPYRDAEGNAHPNLQAYFGVAVTCYDPGYEPFSRLPSERFDGVVCTDVLEHVPEEDVPWVLAELFAFARRFVFANVACFPAAKRLPNGQNAHCTVKPVAWWRREVQRAAARNPEVRYEIRLVERDAAGRAVEAVIEGGPAASKESD